MKSNINKNIKFRYDDLIEAYSEAISHLELCSGQCGIWENPEEMKNAYLFLAKKLEKEKNRVKYYE